MVDPPQIMYTNVIGRDHTAVPTVTDYWLTPPCQAFSKAGNGNAQKPLAEAIAPFMAGFDTIEAILPVRVYMENVPQLVTKYDGQAWDAIVTRPVALKNRYYVEIWDMNARNCGNLQNREHLPATPFRTDRWKGVTEGVTR